MVPTIIGDCCCTCHFPIPRVTHAVIVEFERRRACLKSAVESPAPIGARLLALLPTYLQFLMYLVSSLGPLAAASAALSADLHVNSWGRNASSDSVRSAGVWLLLGFPKTNK